MKQVDAGDPPTRKKLSPPAGDSKTAESQHKYVERFESKDPGARGAEGGAAAVLDLLSGGTTAGCDRLRCGVLHQTAVGTPERLSHGSKHR